MRWTVILWSRTKAALHLAAGEYGELARLVTSKRTKHPHPALHIGANQRRRRNARDELQAIGFDKMAQRSLVEELRVHDGVDRVPETSEELELKSLAVRYRNVEKRSGLESLDDGGHGARRLGEMLQHMAHHNMIEAAPGKGLHRELALLHMVSKDRAERRTVTFVTVDAVDVETISAGGEHKVTAAVADVEQPSADAAGAQETADVVGVDGLRFKERIGGLAGILGKHLLQDGIAEARADVDVGADGTPVVLETVLAKDGGERIGMADRADGGFDRVDAVALEELIDGGVPRKASAMNTGA